MNFPVRILSETRNSGIRADIYHFEDTISRIYSENILLCHLKGSLKVTVSGSTFAAATCSLLFVPNGETVIFDSHDSYVLILFISDTALENRQFQIQIDSHAVPALPAYLPILAILRQFIDTNMHQRTFPDLLKKKLCQDLLYEILSSFCFPGTFQQSRKSHMQSVNANQSIPDTFAELLKSIDANYMENIQLKQLAATFYYTPSHLSKLFVHYTGQLFSDYLTQLRLSKAMPLLLHTSLEIAQISDQCGFPNARAFGQAFQKYYHCRPSVYRKQYYEQADGTISVADADEMNNLKELGVFDALSDIDVSANSSEQTCVTGRASVATPCLQRHMGNISLAHGIPTSAAYKNNILNIDFCRDLLIEDVQMQVRQLLNEIDYEYITLDYFLADEMQVYFSDNLNADFTVKERSRREISFDFSMYDHLLNFVETTGLKPIISLTYMPSFLAINTDCYDSSFHSCKCMPFSMTEWQAYIYTLFAHLKKKHGQLLSNARIFLWKVPDVITASQTSISEEDYFELYTCTFQTIRSVLPYTAIDSPTISCTNSGLAFMKRFLNHCAAHNCMPDQILFTYFHANKGQFHFPSSFLDCTNFFSSVNDYLKGHFARKALPLCILNYNFAFGRNYYTDGLPGAMLPIILTLNQADMLTSLGMEKPLDYTTRFFFGNSQFSATLSAITARGGRKATYYSLKFLQALGNEMIINKPGCCITKDSHKITMLLYYNIPMNEWKYEFRPDTAKDFYACFPDMEFSIVLSELPFTDMILQEQSLTYENGSAYETWIQSGWYKITNADSIRRPKLSELVRSASENISLNEPIYTSFPVISNRKISTAGIHNYTYACRLKPFEIRLVELINADDKR